MCLHDISIQRNFLKNTFINENAIKKQAKISESRSFLLRYRITYALIKNTKIKCLLIYIYVVYQWSFIILLKPVIRMNKNTIQTGLTQILGSSISH